MKAVPWTPAHKAFCIERYAKTKSFKETRSLFARRFQRNTPLWKVAFSVGWPSSELTKLSTTWTPKPVPGGHRQLSEAHQHLPGTKGRPPRAPAALRSRAAHKDKDSVQVLCVMSHVLSSCVASHLCVSCVTHLKRSILHASKKYSFAIVVLMAFWSIAADFGLV